MSSIVSKRKYEMQLPINYVEVEKEEMEYIDGGNRFTDWALSVDTVGSAINTVIAAAIPGGYITGYVSRLGARTAARYLEAVVANRLKLMGIAVGGYLVQRGLEMAFDALDVGGRFASWLDSFDTSPNNGIVWFGN